MTDSRKADHVLVLRGHPVDGWKLECRHEPGKYFTAKENGEWESDECPLPDYFDAEGLDLLSWSAEWPDYGLEIPLGVEDLSQGEPVLVPVKDGDDDR